MKKLYKKIGLTSIFVLFFTVSITVAQEQTDPDPIKSYPGIPIITYHGLSLDWAPPFEQYQQIDSAGIFALQMTDLTENIFESRVENTGLLVMPEQHKDTLGNFIVRYTEAFYTEFEAEGTPTEDGLVTLYNDSLDLTISNGAVSTKPTTQHGTMIYGPMYQQSRNYWSVNPRTIPYRAAYHLKIEDLDPWLESSPDDTVCILQVTTTRTWQRCEWVVGIDTFRTDHFTDFEQTIVVKDTLITYGMLQPVGQWKPINLDYSFTHDIPWLSPYSFPHSTTSRQAENPLDGKINQNCVEFKVIWKGKADRVKLSVDKIIVSDQRGRDLKNPVTYQQIKGNIETQMSNLLSITNERIAGFIGLDEPWSLDMWEPIRIVSEIVESHTTDAKLYFQFNVGFNGRFNTWEDPARGSKAIMIDEFMRRVKNANVWITGWLYDMPCNDAVLNPPCSFGVYPLSICNGGLDYRIINIDFMADSIYKKILNAGETYSGLHYGMSIQTGKYSYSPLHRIREINSKELLYTTNLALLYGSKLLSPWLYFGGFGEPEISTGFRNAPNYEITDKYKTLKDTIAPRLSGLMGKTLRKLRPVNQFSGSRGIDALVDPQEAIPPYDYIEYIHTSGGPNDICFVELGIFEDPQDTYVKYFMPLNRYYSDKNSLFFGLKNLVG
jgi:hypothetical protein